MPAIAQFFTALAGSKGRTLHRRRSCAIVSLVPLSLLFITPACHAALLVSCNPGDSAFLCQLRSILTLLEIAATVLGLILIIAIIAAVRAYRRKPRKLAPKDLTPDAK